MPANGPSVTRISSAMAAAFGAAAKKGCDRRRRALVDVGRPHVERHGRDLEGDTDQQEDEADDKAVSCAAVAALAAVAMAASPSSR